jgi:putative methionine-R-sulfoxide reductase with GAF domain
VEKAIVSEEKDKPVLDELTLAKVLEAAYVLQEHNHELKERERALELKREQLEAEQRSAPDHSSSAQGAAAAQAAEPANGDYTFTLARIVETQHQIQVRQLELENAMALVTERLIEIARAAGAAVGILDGKKLRYRAAAGSLTLAAGTEVPLEQALCAACLRTGQVFRCANITPEFVLDPEECRRRGIQSLIAVPVFHDGAVAGGLELYYSTPQAFTEQDVHSCQLMAGLVTEALARNEEVAWRKSLAAERAEMLETLEQLKPNLEALVDKPAARGAAVRSSAPAAAATESASNQIFDCRKCGHKLVGEEQFCGSCGTPRTGDYEPPSMQSKVASLWHMQEAMKNSQPAAADGQKAQKKSSTDFDRAPDRTQDRAQDRGQDQALNRALDRAPDDAQAGRSLADSLEEEMPELFASAEPTELTNDRTSGPMRREPAAMSAEFEESVLADLEGPNHTGSEDEGDGAAPQSTALAKGERSAAWGSAASAREFLEQLAPTHRRWTLARLWNTRRGDIYLAIAVLLVAGVIRWTLWSNHSVSATASPTAGAADHHKASADADLSWFERMLISLGLAEPPPPPENKGNPETQVWVDLQTALYYCPGTDLYGKTAKGKFTSQHEAQLDQFEPAYRKSCE